MKDSKVILQSKAGTIPIEKLRLHLETMEKKKGGMSWEKMDQLNFYSALSPCKAGGDDAEGGQERGWQWERSADL